MRYFHEFFKPSFWRGFFQLFQQIYLASVSGPCVHFILKICQTVAGTSKLRHFHEFFNLVFGGFFSIVPSVRLRAAWAWQPRRPTPPEMS